MSLATPVKVGYLSIKGLTVNNNSGSNHNNSYANNGYNTRPPNNNYD